MPKAIACIPHKHRMDAHRVDYLRAISDAMDHPFQSEDGREPSPAHQQLEKLVDRLQALNTGSLQTVAQILYKLLFHYSQVQEIQ